MARVCRHYIVLFTILAILLNGCAPTQFVQMESEEENSYGLFGIITTPKMKLENMDAECLDGNCITTNRSGSQVMEIISRAKNTLDASLCANNLTEDQQVSCYTDVAKATNDVSICENIDDRHKKEYCYIQLGKHDPEICQKITGDNDRYSCYILAARESRLIMLCESIALDSELLEPCFRSVISGPELSGKCNELKPDYAEECFLLVL